MLTTLDVPTESIYVETWSYDTIGNAYAALHHFVALQPHIFGTDITVITSQFHITRTRIIFDWVFPKEYNLSYISVDDEGVDETALSARYKRESDSIEGIKKAIEKWGDNIFEFITQEHDLYSAKGLMERSQCKGGGVRGEVLETYGRVSAQVSEWTVWYWYCLIILIVLAIVTGTRRRKRHNT